MRWKSIDQLASRLAALLEAMHPGLVGTLRATMAGDVVRLEGEVGSEACRSDARTVALSFDGVFKVRNDLTIVRRPPPPEEGDRYAYSQKQAPAPGPRTRGMGLGGGPRGRPVTAGMRSPPLARRTRRAGGSGGGDVPAPVAVERRPIVEARGPILPDRMVEVVVDMSENLSGGPGVPLGRFPADWTTIVVAVQLVAPWAARVDALSPAVTLKSDGRSVPARFACLVSPDFEGPSAQVQAVFMHGTRICGHVSVDLPVPGADGRRDVDLHDVPADGAGRGETSSLRIVADASGPSLVVNVTTTAADLQTWTWRVAVPGGVSNGCGRADLEGDAKAFADMLLASCPDLEPPRLGRVMENIGERLWRAAPAEFRASYLSWRNALGSDFPIQFVTDDPFMPWEMMKPDVADARHLFLDHPVARWPLSRSGLLRERLGSGDVLSFVPHYEAGRGLPAAQAEGRWMVDALGAVEMPARTEAFIAVLEGERPGDVAVIHFAGHGRIDTGQSDGGIEMQDDHVGVAEVDRQRTVVGERCATLMLLNACETAGGARMLGMNTGWGAAIAARGFGGLVAPLWEVDDGMAFEMMKSALPDLLAGRSTLGEALRAGRLAHHASSASAFAYLAHGDVMARFPA